MQKICIPEKTFVDLAWLITLKTRYSMIRNQSEEMGKLILRVGMAGMMLPHGIVKVQKLFAAGELSFADPIGLGAMTSIILVIFAEVICSTFVLLGFKTRLATLPLISTMLVAAFFHHAGDSWSSKELPLLFAIGFFGILFLGGGAYSLDGPGRRRR
jgi:putative oxidoreductase